MLCTLLILLLPVSVEAFADDQLILCHYTNVRPRGPHLIPGSLGLVNAQGEANEAEIDTMISQMNRTPQTRNSVHFVINGPVYEHREGAVHSTQAYAIMIPFPLLKEYIFGGYSQDVFTFGPAPLKGATVLVRQGCALPDIDQEETQIIELEEGISIVDGVKAQLKMMDKPLIEACLLTNANYNEWVDSLTHSEVQNLLPQVSIPQPDDPSYVTDKKQLFEKLKSYFLQRRMSGANVHEERIYVNGEMKRASDVFVHQMKEGPLQNWMLYQSAEKNPLWCIERAMLFRPTPTGVILHENSLFHALREWAVFRKTPDLTVTSATLRQQSRNIKEALSALKRRVPDLPQPLQETFGKWNLATRVWLRYLVEAEADLREKGDSFWKRAPGTSKKIEDDNFEDDNIDQRIENILTTLAKSISKAKSI